jgi:hypothetical protein
MESEEGPMLWIEETGGEPERTYREDDRVVIIQGANGKVQERYGVCEIAAVKDGIREPLYRLRYEDGHLSSIYRSCRLLRPASCSICGGVPNPLSQHPLCVTCEATARAAARAGWA